jgi:hypothetical protein
MDEEELKTRQDIDLAFGAAGFWLSATLLFTSFKKGILTKADAIQVVKAARAMPGEHPLPSFAADALKIADHLLMMIEETVERSPSS